MGFASRCARCTVVLVVASSCWQTSLALNRCVDSAGRVSYSDRQCDKHQYQTNLGRVRTVPEPVQPRAAAASAPSARGTASSAPATPTAAGSLGTWRPIECERALWDYDRLPSRVRPKTTVAEMARRRVAAEDICQRPVAVSDAERSWVSHPRTGLDLQDEAKSEAAWREQNAHECRTAMGDGRCREAVCRDRERNRCAHASN
jgi:hypothetical protein